MSWGRQEMLGLVVQSEKRYHFVLAFDQLRFSLCRISHNICDQIIFTSKSTSETVQHIWHLIISHMLMVVVAVEIGS